MDAQRRGSRWLHAQPSEEEVREWFDKQPLHDGMDHERYVSGVVLIGATEKVKVTKQKQNGDLYTAEMEQAVFTPYVKVDTRIAYFWDLVRHLNDGKLLGAYVGVIEPSVSVPRIEDNQSPYFNAHLPDGFFIQAVRNGNDSVSRYIAATFDVAIYERESYIKGERFALIRGSGTKQTPLARQWADDNALMKAETGAVGRALGMAGILVVGTGVATAEDVQEAAGGPSGAGAASAAGATLPADAPGAEQTGAAVAAEGQPTEPEPVQAQAGRTFANDDELRTYARELTTEFQADYPEAWQVFRSWWTDDRKLGGLDDISGPVLRGAVTKLERDLDAAKQVNA